MARFIITTRSPFPSNQPAIAPHPPQNPIAYSPHQTAIAISSSTNPIASISTSNSERHSQPINPIAYSSNIKQLMPPNTHKPDRLFPIKQRSPLITHKTRSPIPHIKQRSHPHHPQTRSPIPSNQTAITPHHPKKPIAYSLKSNSDRPSQHP